MRSNFDPAHSETRTVAEWLERDGQQFGAKQVSLGIAVAEALCGGGSSWAWEREQKIAAALRAAERGGL